MTTEWYVEDENGEEITLTVDFDFTGGFTPATYWEPAEYPEFSYGLYLDGKEWEGSLDSAEESRLEQECLELWTSYVEDYYVD